MYVLGVSFFRASTIVFQVKPSKPCVNVTSIHETIHDNLQHGSYTVFLLIRPGELNLESTTKQFEQLKSPLLWEWIRWSLNNCPPSLLICNCANRPEKKKNRRISKITKQVLQPWNVLLTKNYMDVSQNNGTPKSSILIGFSIIFTIHFGGKTPYFWKYPYRSFWVNDVMVSKVSLWESTRNPE